MNTIDSKQQDSTESIIFIGGYFGVNGAFIDKAALNGLDSVPSEYQKKQQERDRGHYHLTIMLKREMKDAITNIQKDNNLAKLWSELNKTHQKDEDCLLALIQNVCVNDFVDLGVGCVAKNGEEAYFKVIDWPTGHKFRKSCGLDAKDFHITIGFKDKDVHDVAKDYTTLIKN